MTDTVKNLYVMREWLAHLHLVFGPRQHKTAMLHSEHMGPLRVQRPFYPERDGCCHVYLLHPPGGMVIGDQLRLTVKAQPHSQVLLTTPSAGKIYGAKGASEMQSQTISIDIDNACVEWLPQETIVFDGANGVLATHINLKNNGKYFGWDIVRLGRAASGETFNVGHCLQHVEVWREGVPYFIEKNRIEANAPIQTAMWGLQGKNTSGTLLATLVVTRDMIDVLVEELSINALSHWGLTQKKDLFIARYLGDSVSECRQGFEMIWRRIRPLLNDKVAVTPRIWNT